MPYSWASLDLEVLLAVQSRGVCGTHSQKLLSGRERPGWSRVVCFPDSIEASMMVIVGSSCRAHCMPVVVALPWVSPGPKFARGFQTGNLRAVVVEQGTVAAQE